MILLTNKEIESIPTTNQGGNVDDLNIAKAQLKKVMEWGEEMCLDPQHTHKLDYKQRHNCYRCWQDLLKECE